MEQLRLHAADMLHLLPEITLIITAIILSLLDLLLPDKISRTFIGWLSLLGVLVSMVFVFMQMNPAEPIQLLNQSYRVDDCGNLLKIIFLTGTGLVIFMSLGAVKQKDIPHIGEYYYFFL